MIKKRCVLKLMIILGFLLIIPVAFPLFAAQPDGFVRYALVIGSNNGGTDRPLLRYAVTDAQSMLDVLSNLGGVTGVNGWLLVDPDRSSMFAGLEAVKDEIIREKEADNRVELIFYYSGHSDEQGLLLGDEKFFYEELASMIKEMPSDVSIAILDSCSSGALTRTKGGTMRAPFMVDNSYSMEGYAFITSSAEDEASQESDRIGASFFTHYLVSGLRGAADRTRDGRITLNEAYQFAYDETLSRTEKTLTGPQHPMYDIQMTGNGDVVLTDIRESNSVIILGDDVSGTIFIKNDENRLIAEVQKSAGYEMRLALEDGNYQLTVEKGSSLYVSDVKVRNNDEVLITVAQLSPIERETTIPRGSGENGAEELESAVETNTGDGIVSYAKADPALENVPVDEDLEQQKAAIEEQIELLREKERLLSEQLESLEEEMVEEEQDMDTQALEEWEDDEWDFQNQIDSLEGFLSQRQRYFDDDTDDWLDSLREFRENLKDSMEDFEDEMEEKMEDEWENWMDDQDDRLEKREKDAVDNPDSRNFEFHFDFPFGSGSSGRQNRNADEDTWSAEDDFSDIDELFKDDKDFIGGSKLNPKVVPGEGDGSQDGFWNQDWDGDDASGSGQKDSLYENESRQVFRSNDEDQSGPRYAVFHGGLVPSEDPYDQVSTNISLGLLGDYVYDVEGLAFSLIGYNLIGHSANGFLYGTIGTTAGSVDPGIVNGVMLSTFYNWVNGSVSGLQLTGGINIASEAFYGAQISSLYNSAGHGSYALQLSGAVNWDYGYFGGLQVSGLTNVNRGNFDGLQLSGGYNMSYDMRGLQVGVANKGDNVIGAQVGVVNIADTVSGVQVGLINIVDDINGIPIGLINIQRNGSWHIDTWYDESRMIRMGLKYGGDNFYTLIIGGLSDTADLLTFGLGYGGRLNIGDITKLNLDLSVSSVHNMSTMMFVQTPLLHSQVRLFFEFKFWEHFGIFLGASYNYTYDFGDDQVRDISPFYDAQWGDNHHKHWPGFFGGFQF